MQDNPQERLFNYMFEWLNRIAPQIGYYLAGFADGEGSFNVSLKKRSDHTMGWQMALCFNVSQKESYILSQFKKHLGCGRISQRSIDGLYVYNVNNPLAIQEKIIPFFQRFRFISQTKKRNFAIFCKITEMVMRKEHLNETGLKKIVALREALNQGKGRKRKFNQDDVIASFKENPQRLYAKPRAFRQEAPKKPPMI